MVPAEHTGIGACAGVLYVGAPTSFPHAAILPANKQQNELELQATAPTSFPHPAILPANNQQNELKLQATAPPPDTPSATPRVSAQSTTVLSTVHTFSMDASHASTNASQFFRWSRLSTSGSGPWPQAHVQLFFLHSDEACSSSCRAGRESPQERHRTWRSWHSSSCGCQHRVPIKQPVV